MLARPTPPTDAEPAVWTPDDVGLICPADAATWLASAPAEEIGLTTPKSSVSELALGPSEGWFVLYWRVAPPPNKWDWIALYRVGANAKPYPASTANTWQWAVSGTTYSGGMFFQTNSPVREVGFQARYFAWDVDLSAYEAIVLTPEYIGRVCT
jgi:hypothetical protein